MNSYRKIMFLISFFYFDALFSSESNRRVKDILPEKPQSTRSVFQFYDTSLKPDLTQHIIALREQLRLDAFQTSQYYKEDDAILDEFKRHIAALTLEAEAICRQFPSLDLTIKNNLILRYAELEQFCSHSVPDVLSNLLNQENNLPPIHTILQEQFKGSDLDKVIIRGLIHQIQERKKLQQGCLSYLALSCFAPFALKNLFSYTSKIPVIKEISSAAGLLTASYFLFTELPHLYRTASSLCPFSKYKLPTGIAIGTTMGIVTGLSFAAASSTNFFSHDTVLTALKSAAGAACATTVGHFFNRYTNAGYALPQLTHASFSLLMKPDLTFTKHQRAPLDVIYAKYRAINPATTVAI